MSQSGIKKEENNTGDYDTFVNFTKKSEQATDRC